MINDYSPTMDVEVTLAELLADSEGRGRFMAAHHGWAIRRARRYASRQDAEDIVQEVFAGLIEAPPEGVPAGKARAFLSVLIYRRAVDLHRRRARAPFVALVLDGVAEGTGLSTVARRARVFEEIQEAIRRLQTLPRTIIELRYFEGLSSVEIAARLSMTDAAVRSILFRAMGAIRQELGIAG